MGRQALVIAFLFSAACFVASEVHSRTWYVNAAGTGDAPTITAAADSAAPGDTILVGPGTHQTDGSILKPDMVVTSVSGPFETVVEPSDFGQSGAFSANNNCTIEGLWIKGYTSSQVSVVSRDNVIVQNNIFEQNVTGVQIFASSGEITNNLFFGSNWGLTILGTPQLSVRINNNIILSDVECDPVLQFADCNDVPDGIPPCFFGFTNFSVDPLFCGVSGSENFFLRADSPCAPGNHPTGADCGLIGPLSVGCGTVPTEQNTWGSIKALFR